MATKLSGYVVAIAGGKSLYVEIFSVVDISGVAEIGTALISLRFGKAQDARRIWAGG